MPMVTSEQTKILASAINNDCREGLDLLFSLNEFWPAIEPLVYAQKPATIVEIGVEAGAFCEKLLQVCSKLGGKYVGIDPSLDQKKVAWVESQGGSLILQRSVETLKTLPAADIYFIDGDHNYYTVSHELTYIFETAETSNTSPILFLHDTGWPAGRRDFYNNLESIPESERLPSVFEGSIVPGQNLVTKSGFRAFTSHVATCEGGAKNGVRTAIEDVLVQYPAWEFLEIPAVFGLGIIVKTGSLCKGAQVEIDRLRNALQLLGPILKRIEDNRVAMFSENIRLGDNQKLATPQMWMSPPSKVSWQTLHKRKLQTLKMIVKAVAAARPGARPGRLRIESLSNAFLTRVNKLSKFPAETQIACFDMFDTLVRRSVDPPDVIINEAMDFAWLLLTRRRLPITREQVRKARAEASFSLRVMLEQQGLDPECNHREILQKTWSLLECSDIGDTLTDLVENFEIECEIRCMSAMPGAADLLRNLKQAGKTVVVASDTYMPASSLVRILEANGLNQYIDHIFSSADHRAGKYSGGLFRKIAKALDVEFSSISHIGDNIVSDYLAPKRLGAKAHWYLNASEHRRRELSRNSLLQLSSGASLDTLTAGSASARDSAPSKSDYKNYRTLYDLGHSVFGPLFYAFMVQVAEQAIQLGLKDLFFLARDGFGFVKVFEQVWKSLPAVSNFPMPKIHYLYLSRASSLVVLAGEVSSKGVHLALQKDPDILVKDFLHFCGLDLPSAPDPKKYGLEGSAKLAAVRATEAFTSWVSSVAANEEIVRFSNEERSKLRDYLEQNDFFTSGPKALVDVGWNGTIGRFLQSQFSREPNFPELHILLLGRCTSLVFQESRGSPIYFSPGILMDDSGFPFGGKIPFDIPPLIELAASAPHGTTIGYDRDGQQKVTPRLETTYARDSRAPSIITEGWVDFAKHISDRNQNNATFDSVAFSNGAVEKFVRFYRRPPSRFVKAIADCIFSMDWKSQSRVNLVGAGHGWRFYYRFLIGQVAPVTWFYGAAKLFRIPNVFVRLMVHVHREHS